MATAVKKRGPNTKVIRKVALQDASAPTGAFAAPIPAAARVQVTGVDLGFTRRDGVSFRMADLMDEFAQRTTPALPSSLVVRRDLKRYYATLEFERNQMALDGYDAAAWGTLRAAAEGATFDTPKQARMLWAYATESLGPLHPITDMLRGASVARCYAIVDALESLASDVFPVPAAVPAVAESMLGVTPAAAVHDGR